MPPAKAPEPQPITTPTKATTELSTARKKSTRAPLTTVPGSSTATPRHTTPNKSSARTPPAKVSGFRPNPSAKTTPARAPAVLLAPPTPTGQSSQLVQNLPRSKNQPRPHSLHKQRSHSLECRQPFDVQPHRRQQLGQHPGSYRPRLKNPTHPTPSPRGSAPPRQIIQWQSKGRTKEKITQPESEEQRSTDTR